MDDGYPSFQLGEAVGHLVLRCLWLPTASVSASLGACWGRAASGGDCFSWQSASSDQMAGQVFTKPVSGKTYINGMWSRDAFPKRAANKHHVYPLKWCKPCWIHEDTLTPTCNLLSDLSAHGAGLKIASCEQHQAGPKPNTKRRKETLRLC